MSFGIAVFACVCVLDNSLDDARTLAEFASAVVEGPSRTGRSPLELEQSSISGEATLWPARS